MSSAVTNDQVAIERLIEAVGLETIKEFRKQAFPPKVLELVPELVPLDNVVEWLDLPAFEKWMCAHFQRRLGSVTPTPQITSRFTVTMPLGSQLSSTAYSTQSEGGFILNSHRAKTASNVCRPTESSPVTPYRTRPLQPATSLSHTRTPARSDPLIYLTSDCENTPPRKEASLSPSYDPPIDVSSDPTRDSPTPVNRVGEKRKRESSPVSADKKARKGKEKADLPATFSLDSDDDVIEYSDRLISITRETKVHQLRRVTKVLSCWPASPLSEDGKNYQFAFLLDLNSDPRWKFDPHNPIFMPKIIKSQDQDAWGGGTGGSRDRFVKVRALLDQTDRDNLSVKGVLSRYAEHKCQSIYYCPFIDPKLLASTSRYDVDEEHQKWIVHAERSVNREQASSAEALAAAYYAIVSAKRCSAKLPDGTICGAETIDRLFRNPEVCPVSLSS